jgi:hypothetical protein
MNTLADFYAAVDALAAPLHKTHAARLKCGRGCASCCVDGLTVYAVEARNIQQNHAAWLQNAAPHAAGACAFLDEAGACRIYASRPYVCRTQGLPLRWLEDTDDDETLVELRDICPLNDTGEPLEELPEEICWTIGPFEQTLAQLQYAQDKSMPRVALRELFTQP